MSFVSLPGRPVIRCLVLLLGLMWTMFPAPAGAQTAPKDSSAVFPDYPVANGYFFSEAAGGDPSRGYTITDEDGIPFWTAFQRLGSVDSVGFPATGRFTWDGFVDQATQKLILQWNPAAQQVQIVNTFDLMAQRGLDAWLLATKQAPPSLDNSADAGKSWTQVVARHQAELDWNPAIKARYFADADPIAHFGLPQSYADEGNVLVVRCQRAMFQQWKIAVPWAAAGTVTIANGGDIAKEAGILPATMPSSAAALIVAPLGISFSLTAHQEGAVRAAAQAVRPSLVRIVSDVGQGNVSFGSGVIIDSGGLIVTDAHVVAGAQRTVVQLADGRDLPAQLVGRDTLSDVAVLHVPATGLPAVRGNASPVAPGSIAVAIGFTDAFPFPPTIRAGNVITTTTEQVSTATVNLVVDDLYTYFGDSGGPVVNLQGNVIGLVDAGGSVTVQGVATRISYETSFASVLPLVHQITTTGQSIVRPDPGFGGVSLTPALAGRFGLPTASGVLVLRVSPHAPADQAGLIVGDIVTAMDGTPTPNVAALGAVLARHQPGDQVTISYIDPTGSTRTTRLTLAGV